MLYSVNSDMDEICLGRYLKKLELSFFKHLIESRYAKKVAEEGRDPGIARGRKTKKMNAHFTESIV